MSMKLSVDWDWVKEELIRKEKVALSENSEVSKTLEKCLKEAKGTVNPRVTHIIKKIVKIDSDSVIIEGPFKFSSKRLASHIKGSSHIAIFLVTIGNMLEKAATDAMSNGEDLKGYFFDRIGSMAVESVGKCVEENLRKSYANEDRTVSIRFSPGYCDWRIEEQFIIDKILDFFKIGVRLTKACMMVPRKSISAIAGIGPQGRFEKRESPCSFCEVNDCSYKRD